MLATCALVVLLHCPESPAVTPLSAQTTLSAGWRLQDAAKVSEDGAQISRESFQTSGWYSAIVPGTVLTTLVANAVYPEPLYGENNRSIPESLARTSYWYRDVVAIPDAYKGRHVWLNFDGINFFAEVWVNGARAGEMRGAFIRGNFDITALVRPGQQAVIAVHIWPQPHPGIPHEHTLTAGMGPNGGITAIDGPTFLDTIGWDWIPAIRDRDTGIWQKVFLSSTGPVRIENPQVTSNIPLPRTDSADIAVAVTLSNVTDRDCKGILKGSIGDIKFEQPVQIAASVSQTVRFDATTTPSLHMRRPQLWWPSGYGPQHLYHLHLEFVADNHVSDAADTPFGVRKITYSLPGSSDLAISVNGVPVFIRGGDWGMDEALKRNPYPRLDAEIHLHALAHLNMIRNWVGQSTSEDFYDLCDKYGILVWDEFFQPNPSDGPNPDDLDTYLANVRDKILRYRNHPSIALWCGRNEGYPPPAIDNALRSMTTDLDPTRLYQPSSTDGRGVRSGGPYHWRDPQQFYIIDTAFKTETGSMSIPTLESIQGMMPEKDWDSINDDWAEHDFARGAAGGNTYPGELTARYGAPLNLADFVRKGQIMNYEAYRAMYEGRNAHLFHPATGVLTWMSQAAQPSFAFQIYHYDLDPQAAYFAVMKASEPVHVQFDEASDEIQVINNLPRPIQHAKVRLSIFNFDGATASQRETTLTARPEAATLVDIFDPPPSLSPIHFVQLQLYDAAGHLLSENLYWRTQPQNYGRLAGLSKLPVVPLRATVSRADSGKSCALTVTLRNSSPSIALLVHLQLHRKSGPRVLPAFYSDNYVSLTPGESKTITVAAGLADLHGEDAWIQVDGWNAHVEQAGSKGIIISDNENAKVSHWPETGLPVRYPEQPKPRVDANAEPPTH